MFERSKSVLKLASPRHLLCSSSGSCSTTFRLLKPGPIGSIGAVVCHLANETWTRTPGIRLTETRSATTRSKWILGWLARLQQSKWTVYPLCSKLLLGVYVFGGISIPTVAMVPPYLAPATCATPSQSPAPSLYRHRAAEHKRTCSLQGTSNQSPGPTGLLFVLRVNRRISRVQLWSTLEHIYSCLRCSQVYPSDLTWPEST